jgi:tetrahydromethanopterin S-methyltransferase subunit G
MPKISRQFNRNHTKSRLDKLENDIIQLKAAFLSVHERLRKLEPEVENQTKSGIIIPKKGDVK